MSLLPFVISIIVLVTLAYFTGWFKPAHAQSLGAWVKQSSGVLIVFGAAFLLTRNIGLAIFAAGIAYSIFSRTGMFNDRRAGGGRISTVRTAYLEMSLDHDRGTMSGRVLNGSFAGRGLHELSPAEEQALLAELRQRDPQGFQLLEAFLERADPSWRGSGTYSSDGRASSQGMPVKEAYLVLGLESGATREDIQAAHRNLMKRFHPDQGGSTYLASKINEAKDVLLRHVAA